MGQYHVIVAPDARQFLKPHKLGTGLKAWEQLANPLLASGLVAMLAADPGEAPADLPGFAGRGSWAGQRILAIGDYAEDRDIPGWDGPPLSQLYGLCDAAEEPKADDFSSYLPSERARMLVEARSRWTELSAVGYLTDASGDAAPIIEFVRNGRFAGTGWKDFIPVRHARGRWSLGGDQKDKEWVLRMGHPREAWARPVEGAPAPVFDPAAVASGPNRLIANLDRWEYLDPTVFGEAPTLAGIMRGDEGSAAALISMLYHPTARGGGDLSSNELAGAWRNCRICLTTDAPSQDGLPSTDTVRAAFADISKPAKDFIAKELA